MRSLRRGVGVAVAAAMTTLLCVPILASPASAQVLWSTEQTMIGSSYLRDTFVFDPGVGNTISHQQFATGAVADFYHAQGFDRNFLVWAPITAIDRPNEYWKACNDNGGGLCPAASVRTGLQLISDEIGSGPIHVKIWNGAFIGVVCGNWNHAGSGPVPQIRGVKYEDLNADGARQAGEPGLPGWTMTLRYEGTVVASTTTASDGSYAFSLDAEQLPVGAGSYSVSETLKPGWVQSQAPVAVQVDYGAGDHVYGGQDFGNWQPATIQGRKFDDRGVDGSGDGDPGLAGWTIGLDNGTTTTTGSDGSFAFSNVKPGTYVIAEHQRSGWRQTAPASGTTTVTVASGQSVADIDFGNVCTGKAVFRVPDGVGVRLDEIAVPGILTNSPPLPRTATGPVEIGDLLPGQYRATLTLPDGLFTTDPGLTAVDGGFAIVKNVALTECGSTVVEPVFVVSQPGKITGGVRLDVSGGFATGGFEFMQKKEGPRGTLEFNDHASGTRIHTSDITGISTSGNEAYVFGHAVLDGATHSFRLHLVDAGEPGTADMFELLVSNGYSAGMGETIADGNIQVH